MRNSTQDDLIDFYESFYKERRAHFNRSWGRVRHFVFRIANRNSVVISALKKELHYITFHLAKFDLLVRDKEIDREEVVEFKDALKSQKEEFVGRSGFLLILLSIIGIFISLVLKVLNKEGELDLAAMGSYLFTMVLFFAVLFERDGINKRVSTSEQLCIVIDRWLDNNPKEEISVSGASIEDPEEITESFLEELVKEEKEEKSSNLSEI